VSNCTIVVARDERYKRPASLRRTLWVPCLLTCRPGKRPKPCIEGFPSQMSPRLALMQPHLQQSRDQATSSPLVLLVQDTTAIDLSHRHKISGVGQIGNERGRGFFVQTVLAVRPQTREVLGCMAQEPFVRMPARKARTAVATAQARGARNRCLDAPGARHWHP
jgi:hypothetical protein